MNDLRKCQGDHPGATGNIQTKMRSVGFGSLDEKVDCIAVSHASRLAERDRLARKLLADCVLMAHLPCVRIDPLRKTSMACDLLRVDATLTISLGRQFRRRVPLGERYRAR